MQLLMLQKVAKAREKYLSKSLAQEQKLTYIYRTLSEKKSQDRKEDRIENPEGSQDQSGFLLFSYIFNKVIFI
jgi:hypothetical protein